MDKRPLPAGCIRLSTHVVQFPLPTATLPPENFTNTYVIHHGTEGLVVDAGSTEKSELDKIQDVLDALGCTQIRGLVATHYHHDHTAGLPYLARKLKAPIYVQQLDLEAAIRAMRQNVPEPADPSLVKPAPPHIEIGSLTVKLEHLPGHTHGHLHVLVPDDEVVLVGDHLSGFGTVWIGPPDGHMQLYYQALDILITQHYRIAGPGHGKVLLDVSNAAATLRARRQAREQQMIDALETAPKTKAELTRDLYGGDLSPAVQWAAQKTVAAHLAYLRDQKRVGRLYDPNRQVFVYDLAAPRRDN